jgi:hypothetical protein
VNAPTELRRQRRQRMAAAVHALGSRVVFELLDEIGRHHGIANDIDTRLAKYAKLDRRLLRTVGGDRFAPPPLRVVAGGRH